MPCGSERLVPSLIFDAATKLMTSVAVGALLIQLRLNFDGLSLNYWETS